MGTVHLARDNFTETVVALKILLPALTKDPQARARFIREINLARSVTDDHVVKTFDCGEWQEQIYLSMEYIDGKLLKNYVGQESPDHYVRTISEIAHGLGAIHNRGIIHRDLKPSNIIVDKNGTPKIMDFGVARPSQSELTSQDEIVGSAPYMPLEMWRGNGVSEASDIYALGALWYELLTGVLPFDGKTSYEILARHSEGKPLPPRDLKSDIPQWINDLILMMLAKDAALRPQNASHLLSLLDGTPSECSPFTTTQPEALATVGFIDARIIPDAEPLILTNRSLEDTPVQLDPETSNRAAYAGKNIKSLARKNFGKIDNDNLLKSALPVCANWILTALMGIIALFIVNELLSTTWASYWRELKSGSSLFGIFFNLICTILIPAVTLTAFALATINAARGINIKTLGRDLKYTLTISIFLSATIYGLLLHKNEAEFNKTGFSSLRFFIISEVHSNTVLQSALLNSAPPMFSPQEISGLPVPLKSAPAFSIYQLGIALSLSIWLMAIAYRVVGISVKNSIKIFGVVLISFGLNLGLTILYPATFSLGLTYNLGPLVVTLPVTNLILGLALWGAIVASLRRGYLSLAESSS
jgi:serine/threonine protein kinase